MRGARQVNDFFCHVSIPFAQRSASATEEPTSPYVRKVSITAIETGLADKIERVTTDPWSAETDLGNSNPIGKVPCLITDDGMAIYDSPVICEYLDSLNTGEKLIPASGEARFKALTLAAAADAQAAKL